ncbi:valine--pyruvate transaminase [Roseibacillus ishigakijimensis]|uniref:Valine--pyruvate transaminase n=1 Tax=Roseibacillus ishigakijimensis TaxID=454146 RepID=A0A934RQ15_9BACT|nr:valine--pyruvate transaminase [Roseibacillus ishigakijimensis]MBK1834865.1 valine--pyruvate transaminase [Roseibacillus ishigakijimensis]
MKTWEWSEFGKRLGNGSGIAELMTNLGEAMAGGGDIKMLGGGQPAHIPEVEAVWERRWREIQESGELRKVLGSYEAPAGGGAFREALAAMLNREFGWPVGPENIAVTAGGQTAFFFLFNSLAGQMPDGRQKKILLPLVPEYIGYSDQSVGSDIFRVFRPHIEKTGPHEFKYTIDFDALEVGDDVAAICVSRPTNPSGNLLLDEEIDRLRQLAAAHGIPLIIDNAYGAPFPNVIFGEASPVWDEDLIVTMSLSKLGLPGTRTGIVVAREEVARALAEMTGVVGLANNNVGQAIVAPLLGNGELLRLSNEVMKPFYEEKSRQAQAWAREFFPSELTYYFHRSEGALFLWFWFEGLPISSRELYERCQRRGVLVVPGEFFFFGEERDWAHGRECIRVTFTMPAEVVREGLRIIAEEVAAAYQD